MREPIVHAEKTKEELKERSVRTDEKLDERWCLRGHCWRVGQDQRAVDDLSVSQLGRGIPKLQELAAQNHSPESSVPPG